MQSVSDKEDERLDKSANPATRHSVSAEELERITGMDGAEALRRAEAGEDTVHDSPDDDGEDKEPEEEEEKSLEGKISDAWSKAGKEDDAAGKGLYSGLGEDDGFISNLRKRRKMLAGIGAGAGILLIIGGMFFSFLNVFKLDHIMSNIDIRTFSRMNAATDRRSDRWVRTYIQLRLARLQGSGADPDSEYFRSNRVDTDNPVRDWYRTLRTSNFEAELAKQGIVFANKDGPNGITYSVLQVKGEQVAGLSAQDLRKGKLVDLINSRDTSVTNLLDINLSEPGGNKKARADIKKRVNDIARDKNVFERRQIRKAFQNQLGVRNWRFFEKTRDKASTAKNAFIRDKIVLKAVPETTKAGLLLSCLLGGNCKGEGDPGSVDEEASKMLTKDGSAKNVDELSKKILTRAGLFGSVINIAQTLNTFSKLDGQLHDGKLSGSVALARGSQAMALYQIFKTSRDQIKTGELTGDELNSFMQTIGNAANSEAYTKVLDGTGETAITDTPASRQYCSEEHQAFINKPENRVAANKEFHYLCPDKQISGSSNAKSIEEAYNSTVGTVVHPLLDGYGGFINSLSSIPGVSHVLDFVNWVAGKFSTVLLGIVNVLGFGHDVQQFMLWITNGVMGFLGAGPIMSGQEPAGVYMNWITQGGAYAAESTSRQLGAQLSNPATVASNASLLADYTQDNNAQMSVFQKYLSLDNPESAGSQWAFAASNAGTGTIASALGGISHGFFGVFSNLTARAHAATDDGRRGANFAGIEMYDFPAQCTEKDPLDMNKPSDGSNIGAVLGQGAADAFDQAGWDVARDSVQWYTFLYKQSTDAKLVKTVYNCNLLDNAVRSGLGYLHGYTNDFGLEDGGTPAAGAGTTPNPTTPGSGPASTAGYRNPLRAIMANGSLAPLRIDEGVDYGGHGPIYAIGPGVVVATTTHSSFWACCGGESTVYKLTAGPASGKSVFFAESCTPAVKPGDIVDSNTIICTMHGDNSPWTESGWAIGNGTDTPAAYPVYKPDGVATAYGVNFSDLMKSLGAPPGDRSRSTNNPTVVGTLPPGWPSW